MKKMMSLAVTALALTGCAALVNTGDIDLDKQKQQKTYAPIISSMTANPTNTTTGEPITFEVKASDPNGQAIQYSWSSSQGVISASAGQLVSWTPPSIEGVYPIQVTITNQDGLSTSGSLNVIVKANGQVSVGAASAAAE